MNPSLSPLPPPPEPRPFLQNTSCLSHCSLLDLSITADSAYEPRPPTIKPLPQRGNRSSKVQLDLVSAPEPCPLALPLSQQEPIRDQRRTVCLHETRTQELGANAAYPEEAGLNTTLALRAELQSLQGEQWDSVKAVKENLDQRTQALINSRATAGVSFPRRAQLYSALVSVHVPEGHVIREAVQPRPPSQAPPPSTTGPSLLPLTFDLCYHRPLPQQTNSPAPALRPRPHSAPFSLYQRQQRWAS